MVRRQAAGAEAAQDEGQEVRGWGAVNDVRAVDRWKIVAFRGGVEAWHAAVFAQGDDGGGMGGVAGMRAVVVGRREGGALRRRGDRLGGGGVVAIAIGKDVGGGDVGVGGGDVGGESSRVVGGLGCVESGSAVSKNCVWGNLAGKRGERGQIPVPVTESSSSTTKMRLASAATAARSIGRDAGAETRDGPYAAARGPRSALKTSTAAKRA